MTTMDGFGTAEGRMVAYKRTLEEVRSELADRTGPAFIALSTDIQNVDAEIAALDVTSESAQKIFEDWTGLVRDWGDAWIYSKTAVLTFQQALDGVELEDFPGVPEPGPVEGCRDTRFSRI